MAFSVEFPVAGRREIRPETTAGRVSPAGVAFVTIRHFPNSTRSK
jgi:hypothetical protein